MTLTELGQRVLDGHLIVVGELRRCQVQPGGWVDPKHGLAAPKLLVVYLVECMRARGIENVKITRFYPEPFPEPETIINQVRKGLRYAFECTTVKKDKAGITVATMDAVDPIALEDGETPAPAPGGGGAAA
ncbi:MAG: hypothetical protein ACKV19_23555 [Verrucomicrobiales bacterium]